MLEIRNLSFRYGQVAALRGISLTIEKGEVLALLGPNGAGKSTLVHVLAGLLQPESGSLRFEGEDLAALSARERVERGIVLVPEGRGMFGPLTVLENLELGAYHRVGKVPASQIREDMDWALSLFPVLSRRLNQKAGSLSGGEQQMLALARALMARPRLLLLDEPSLGLAPKVIRDIFAVLAELNRSGLTLAIVEQKAPATLRIAHRVAVLRTGELIRVGTPAEIGSPEVLREVYLGQKNRYAVAGQGGEVVATHSAGA